MIVVVPSSGNVCRQWRGCDSDNGRNLIVATAIGLADSPVVELFAVAEQRFTSWEFALLEGIVFVFVAGLASFLAGNIPCKRAR